LVSLWSKSHYRPGRERSAPGLARGARGRQPSDVRAQAGTGEHADSFCECGCCDPTSRSGTLIAVVTSTR
jgi:hypothetical protein